jgi:fatty-acyl-CoA synthase
VPPALRLAPPTEIADDTIGGLLRRAAATAPDVVALVDGVADPAARTRWTYAELLARAEGIAHGLLGRFTPGERLAVWAPTAPESLVLTYACALAGLVLVPVNPALRANELAHVLGQSGAAGIALVDEHRGHDMAATLAAARAGLPVLREAVALTAIDDLASTASTAHTPDALPAVRGDDVAQIVYTSGTTGHPKGARLTHRGMTSAARFGARRFGMERGDVYVDPLPLFHVGGQVVAFEIAHQCATYVLVRAFEPALVLDLLESEHATLTVGVPTMLVAMLAEPGIASRDLSRLRSVSSGGAVVPAELVRRVRRELGASVTIVFGQTECCGFVAQTHLDDEPEVIEATLGTPIDGVDVRVVDPATGTVVETGAVGELEVRGDNVMAGYHDRPDATAEAMHDGWLRTGDLVTLDDAGYLRIVGRLKDMIVTGGVNVYAAEVEAAIAEHPSVADVAVFGVPDDRWGERVVAAVRFGPDPAVGDPVTALADDLATRLAPYKLPKQWTVVETMPLTASGKVQKFLLREQLGMPPRPAGAAAGT